jgi:2-polyprenyl-3-methyl-5-hydroxy-6-metoxy-1,4-benzoquinol methylase
MNSVDYVKCPLCHSKAHSLWPAVRVCKCTSCYLLFRYPAASEDELKILYESSWSNPTKEIEETGATSSELAHDYVSEIAKSLGINDLKGLRILDYGAGRGAMIKVLLDSGADVYGVEPFGFELLRENGYKAFRSLNELPEGIQFDGVISIDVIEHVNNPWDDYEKLKGILHENGWLYISTPNAAGINARFYRAEWREIANRGHLFFFSPTTLERTLKKSGYKNIKRLQWFINYRRGFITSVFHWLFQFLKIDGELRYLAFK